MAVRLQFELTDIQDRIAMPGAEYPFVVRSEQQVKMVILLPGFTRAFLQGRLIVFDIGNRQMAVLCRILTDIYTGQTFRHAGYTEAHARQRTA